MTCSRPGPGQYNVWLFAETTCVFLKSRGGCPSSSQAPPCYLPSLLPALPHHRLRPAPSHYPPLFLSPVHPDLLPICFLCFISPRLRHGVQPPCPGDPLGMGCRLSLLAGLGHAQGEPARARGPDTWLPAPDAGCVLARAMATGPSGSLQCFLVLLKCHGHGNMLLQRCVAQSWNRL